MHEKLDTPFIREFLTEKCIKRFEELNKLNGKFKKNNDTQQTSKKLIILDLGATMVFDYKFKSDKHVGNTQDLIFNSLFEKIYNTMSTKYRIFSNNIRLNITF